jgi:hypothetical protein
MVKKTLILMVSVLLLFPIVVFGETFSLNLRYTPTSTEIINSESKLVIAITDIVDNRMRKDKTLMGERLTYRDKKEFFAPSGISLEEGITGMVAGYFKRRGFQWKRVGAWDNMDANNLKEEWGDIVVGGEIIELWNDVVSRFMSNKHKVKAKLEIVVADPKEKMILWRDTATTSLELKEPLFHLESVERIINESISTCIDNIFEDQAFKAILSEFE